MACSTWWWSSLCVIALVHHSPEGGGQEGGGQGGGLQREGGVLPTSLKWFNLLFHMNECLVTMEQKAALVRYLLSLSPSLSLAFSIVDNRLRVYTPIPSQNGSGHLLQHSLHLLEETWSFMTTKWLIEGGGGGGGGGGVSFIAPSYMIIWRVM